MKFCRLRTAAYAATLVLISSTPGTAQTIDELFDPGSLEDVRLIVNERDLQLLRERYLEDTYYPADITWRGIRLRNVGIRSRGTGSRNPTKLGLRIDFNRYVSDQDLLGLDALVLDNLWQDPALIRERVSMAFFARMGQPSPREAFCRLYINDVFQGVYTLVEPIDETFLARTLGENAGYLFEYQWQQHFIGEYLGQGLTNYVALFEAETHDSQPESVLYGPIHDLFREVNAEDDARWEERVNAYLDIRQFVTQAAIERFLADIDGLLGNWGMNNFFLYRPADGTQHRVFPWDKDTAFDASDQSVLLHVDENAILSRAFARSDLRALYLSVLEQCARSALQDNWLAREIEATATLIRDAAHADSLKPITNAELDAALDFLRDFARRRPAFVLQQVAALRKR